jgi:ribosomal protein S18 acetylase RimI-like enzyme
MSDYTARFLERRDLLQFLSGQLLGFALDDYFDGAYLGAFDSRGQAVGFIFTGHGSDSEERLIGVPHILENRAPAPEAEEFLIARAASVAGEQATSVLAAIYSDQSPEDRERLQQTYENIGFSFLRDSSRMFRDLTDVPEPSRSLVSIGAAEAGQEALADIASRAAEGSEWESIDFRRYLDIWSSSRRYDPGLFRIYREEGDPAGVFMARLDRVDPSEGGFYFLGVLPDYRRSGLGRDMLFQGLHMLRNRGADKTRQIVPFSEGPGMRLLTGCGYSILEWARYFVLG